MSIRLPLISYLLVLTAVSLPAVTLDSSVTIVISGKEPAALRKAGADLASDFAKVFGKPVRVVSDASEVSGSAVCIALEANLPDGAVRPKRTEELEIRAIARPWRGKKVESCVLLTGADLRGAIYAVYEFSQRFLGVDPLWFWTDHEPARRTSVTVPAGFRLASAPAFRYRGWFMNDEDLLTMWSPGKKDGTGISLEIWERVFEALLRLKGNMIVPGTFLFPDEPQVRAASDRGLVISQHHIEVVGLNTWRWPEDVPYSFANSPGLLVQGWRHAIDAYLPNQEVIWTVGYRGKHDRAFWLDDTSVDTDEARGKMIGSCINIQLELVRRDRPHAGFLMNAWDEAVPLIRQGFLKVSSDVTLVWPDNGFGVIRDEGAIAKGQGIYYHTAMYNYRANQLSENIPLERIQRELGRAARAGATEYLLVNTSDLRPVPMTTRAVMELAWEPKAWVAGTAARDYMAKWTTEEFGAKASAGASAFYRAYFEAPGRFGKAEHETFADNAYHYFARYLITTAIAGKGEAPRYLAGFADNKALAAHLAAAARGAEPRWAVARLAAEKASAVVEPGRREFFQGHVLTQLDVNEYSNRMLGDIAEAVAGQRAARTAIASIDQVLAALRKAEYGKWRDFYREELFVKITQTRSMVEAWNSWVEGKGVPAGTLLQALPPDPYVPIKAYQGSRRVQLGY
ncbi:MAG: glycosyl hydrolase 115 family protein [Acidobacteria bacterium]|nr:glycosyl hydrolase 115 family protein [Acidobacteriota bacterium]